MLRAHVNRVSNISSVERNSDTWVFQWLIIPAPTFRDIFTSPPNSSTMQSPAVVRSYRSIPYDSLQLIPLKKKIFFCTHTHTRTLEQVKRWCTVRWVFPDRQHVPLLIWWSIEKCRQPMPFERFACVATFARMMDSWTNWPIWTTSWEERGNTLIH